MSKVPLNPDLIRDIRDIQKRLDTLEALYSGPRFYGPFTLTTSSIPTLSEASFSYAHNLGVTPTAVLFEQEDGNYASRVTTRVVRDATNVTFVAFNVSPTSAATVVYRFWVLV